MLCFTVIIMTRRRTGATSIVVSMATMRPTVGFFRAPNQWLACTNVHRAKTI